MAPRLCDNTRAAKRGKSRSDWRRAQGNLGRFATVPDAERGLLRRVLEAPVGERFEPRLGDGALALSVRSFKGCTQPQSQRDERKERQERAAGQLVATTTSQPNGIVDSVSVEVARVDDEARRR